MRDLRLHVRYAIRTFRQTPLMSLLVAGSLALGIAANTTVFSFVNAIQFKRRVEPGPPQRVAQHHHWLGAPRGMDPGAPPGRVDPIVVLRPL